MDWSAPRGLESILRSVGNVVSRGPAGGSGAAYQLDAGQEAGIHRPEPLPAAMARALRCPHAPQECVASALLVRRARASRFSANGPLPICICVGMAIEQVRPNKPNFGLILGLFCVTILAILVLAYLFVDFDGTHLRFRQHARGMHSSLSLPATDQRAV